MFTSVRGYFYERRAKFFRTAGFFGGIYLTAQYVSARLEEVKERVVAERAARETLLRRFKQTKEDAGYQIMALVPTLAEQVLEGMDVESVTRELQDLSREAVASKKAKSEEPSLQIPTLSDNSSIGASGVLVNANSIESSSELAPTESTEDNAYLSDSVLSGSVSSAAAAAVPDVTPEKFDLGINPYSTESRAPITESSDAEPSTSAEKSQPIKDLETSVASFTTSNSGGSQSSSHQMLTRTKAELWREVKMLTFTRTLTTLYATALLSLFTTLQFTVLARAKYVRSICLEERAEFQAELAEIEHERHARAMSAMLGPKGIGGDVGRAVGLAWRLGVDAVVDEYLNSYQEETELGQNITSLQKAVEDELDDDAETKYLTLVWWVLNHGWKDVGERVRRGVEDVFEGVSLKTRLSAADLHRLIGDVRRRVEWEVTFEGRERRVDFLSALIPPTAEMTQYALAQGGYQPPPQTQTKQKSTYPPKSPQNDVFSALVSETRDIILSPDFSAVLEAALDQGVNILCQGVVANVFEPSRSPSPVLGEEERVRLAGMLPGLARWSKLALEGLPNELVDTMTDLHEVQSLSAIVFGRFEERFSNT